MNGLEFARLLPAMLPRLWTFALRLSGDQHEAEDLVQRACVRGLESAHQLRSESSPLSWMFAITHSIWLNEVRARKVRKRWSAEWDDDLLERVADSNVRTPEENVMNGQIIKAVERLPETCRVVLLLVAEGLSYNEMAEVLEVPKGTVMSRLSRARRVLAESLDQSNETLDPDEKSGKGAV
jgi:RNA polymerase sigma-70 factor (ECF subfamily)